MKVEWISHKGKRILFADYSNIKSQEELLKIQADSIELAKKASGSFLSLADITNTAMGPEFMKISKEQGKDLKGRMDKSAIVGVTGLKSMLLKGYNMFAGGDTTPFDTKEEALEYLVS